MSEIGRRIVQQIPHLRRYAWALAGDRGQVDDLVQACLERAWSRLHLFEPESNIRAWLFTILHNIYANAARARARQPRLEPLESAAPHLAVAPKQELGLKIDDLRRALASLPENQRAVVLLVGLEGMSYAEAAAILGIPTGTLMSRLHRGRERLRQMMSGEIPPSNEEKP